MGGILIWIGTNYSQNKSQGYYCFCHIGQTEGTEVLAPIHTSTYVASSVLLTQGLWWEFELLRLPLCTCFYTVKPRLIVFVGGPENK
jgi:hypothetical protein